MLTESSFCLNALNSRYPEGSRWILVEVNGWLYSTCGATRNHIEWWSQVLTTTKKATHARTHPCMHVCTHSQSFLERQTVSSDIFSAVEEVSGSRAGPSVRWIRYTGYTFEEVTWDCLLKLCVSCLTCLTLSLTCEEGTSLLSIFFSSVWIISYENVNVLLELMRKINKKKKQLHKIRIQRRGVSWYKSTEGDMEAF